MSKKGEFFLRIAVVLLAIFAIVMLLVLRLEISKLQTEKESLEASIAEYSKKIDALEEKLSSPDEQFNETTEDGTK